MRRERQVEGVPSFDHFYGTMYWNHYPLAATETEAQALYKQHGGPEGPGGVPGLGTGINKFAWFYDMDGALRRATAYWRHWRSCGGDNASFHAAAGMTFEAFAKAHDDAAFNEVCRRQFSGEPA